MVVWCFHLFPCAHFPNPLLPCRYNVIGLYASLGGMLFECTDSSCFYAAILKDLGSMEFWHLSKLIHLVVIPLVKNCPDKSWKILIVNLLQPLLMHFGNVLEHAWSSMLHHGRARVPYHFGNLHGSLEIVRKLEETLLLEFTREVCDLLGVLALPELNKGLTSFQNRSLVGYLIFPVLFVSFSIKNQKKVFIIPIDLQISFT